MELSFKNTRFLITRPEQQAKNLSRQITALGGQCFLLPTIDIKFLDQNQSIEFQQQFPGIDKIIFLSSHAVLAVMPHWPKTSQLPPVFAVGSGTAATLASFSITAKIPEENAFNTEGLLALSELENVVGQTIVLYKGVGGRQLLADILRARGANVMEIPVYERCRPTVDITTFLHEWKENGIDFIISTSCESLENLYSLFDKEQIWLKHQQLLVISPGMKTLAKKLGFKQPPILAKNASDQAILTAALSAISGKEYLKQTQ